MNYPKYYRDLVRKLNRKKFLGLKGFNVGNACVMPFLKSTSNIKERYLKSLVYNLLFMTTDLQLVKKGSTLFYRAYYTENQNKSFKKAFNIVPNASFASVKFQKFFSFKRLISSMFFLVISFFKLLGMKLNFRSKILYLTHMLQLRDVKKLFSQKINVNEFEALVTYCDTEGTENILTQMFNAKNKTTITLQHGHFMSTVENSTSPESVGVSYETMISNYFFCWGECAKNQAEQSGVSAKILCVGAPQFIGVDELPLNKNKKLGVFLTGWGVKEIEFENETMIGIANEFCKNNGYKYYLRSHNSTVNDKIMAKIDKNFFDGHCPNNKTLTEFASECEICLVGSTSCFAELLFLGKSTFKLKNDNYKMYDKIDEFIISTANEIENKLLDLENLKKERKKIVCYIMGSGNIEQNYYNSFKEILETHEK